MSATVTTQTLVRQRVHAPLSSTVPVPTTVPIRVHGRVVARVPTAKPAFTLADIRRAIPSSCFERNLITSFGYVVYDLSIIASLFYLATHIPSIFPSSTFGALALPLQHALWLCYWVCQGCVMTGVWVIGHECGHGGFADSALVNDCVGFVLHSLLLVPYFSWQISHRKHHSNTGNLQRDEVFVPRVVSADHVRPHEEEKNGVVQLLDSLYRSVRIVLMLTVGWPLYLFTNATGNSSYPKDSPVNHFHPSSPIYADIRKGPSLVLLSDLGLLLALGVLGALSYAYSLSAVLYFYGVPYLVTNLFLVLITFLQHTDAQLPHYAADEWDWLRGALATVDRDYGVLNSVMHHIMDTHVVHHLFSSMPHYHAQEATEAVKALLGPYYAFDDTPIVKALWTSYTQCEGVKEDANSRGVYWY